MNYHLSKIYCLSMFFLLLSCTKKVETESKQKKRPTEKFNKYTKDPINSFGKARIGMSISEFNEVFQENLKDTIEAPYHDNKNHITKGFRELDITEDIKLKLVGIVFINGKLERIQSQYDKTLFEKFQKKYGGSLKETNIRIFKVNLKEIFLEYDSKTMWLSSYVIHP